MIPPAVRARLERLHLYSRFAGRALTLGQHAGRNRGAGLEFAQFRAYEPGDEPRSVDWKLYARADRFYVREAARDSALRVWVVLDTTLSMAAADEGDPRHTKLEAAKQLTACIIEIALRQGDAFGFVTLGRNATRSVGLGSGAGHRARVEHELDLLQAQGAAPDAAGLRPFWRTLSAGSLVIVLSDGFDPVLCDWQERLSLAARDVRSIGLLTPAERDFPFTGGCIFRDPESGAERRVDAGAARDAYLDRLRRAREALRRRLAASGVPHVDYVLDEPLDFVLRRLLARHAGDGGRNSDAGAVGSAATPA